MIAPRSLMTRLLLPCLLAACAGPATQQRADDRLVKAEAEMNACKQGLGLGAAPTPTTTALYDPATGSVAQDAAQVKIKTLCGRQLYELLDAQRVVKELHR